MHSLVDAEIWQCRLDDNMIVLLADDAVKVFDSHDWSMTEVFSIILSSGVKQSLRNP